MSEAQYRDMTNAYRIAAEAAPGHPTRELWEQRRAALLKLAISRHENFRCSIASVAKGEVYAFLATFQARFPGVECSIRGIKSDQPVATITARRMNFGRLGAIERSVHAQDRFHWSCGAALLATGHQLIGTPEMKVGVTVRGGIKIKGIACARCFSE